MNDKEAFEEWLRANFSKLVEIGSKGGLSKMNDDLTMCWQAACDYKQKELDDLKTKLTVCKNDYWFMINLIEKYSSNKEEALKDCLERMKFRKGLFNILGGLE
jgi:hypothetical protein